MMAAMKRADGHQHPLAGIAAALGSALLVGLFTVINKWTLRAGVAALAAGAWTYAAAGVALLPWAVMAGGFKWRRWLVVIGWLLAGSVAGPALYFLGLALTSGVEGVLMINMESVFTALLAFLIFRERLTVTTLIGGAVILGGGVWLSWPAGGGHFLAGSSAGNLLIALGYLGWATENNLGRILGREIPTVTLVCVKALVAGGAMAVLAILFGQSMAVAVRAIPGIAASGALCLGLSLALFYWAMQKIGAGRTGLISATSVLWGVLAAFVLLRESLTWRILGGGALMIAGFLLFTYESVRSAKKKQGGPG